MRFSLFFFWCGNRFPAKVFISVYLDEDWSKIPILVQDERNENFGGKRVLAPKIQKKRTRSLFFRKKYYSFRRPTGTQPQ